MGHDVTLGRAPRNLRREFTDVRFMAPPPGRQEVPRPSLEALLATCSKRRLTIVSAGPGWGKTTAVAHWARRAASEGSPLTAWLTLQVDDNVPAVFWTEVLRAIELSGAVPPDSLLSSGTTAVGVTEEVLQALFRGLSGLPRPLLLVLDDFHLIDDPTIHEAVTNLVAHDSPVNLMVLTRTDPALPLHQLRVAEDLAEVRAADLAFDFEDVLGLAGPTQSPPLTSEHVDTILARTEGWPVGVKLAIMYRSREDDATLERFGGTERWVAEYLIAEVLEQHDREMVDFLLRTSVVEWLTGDLAEALAPDSHGLARLEMLEHAGSFVICIDRDRSIYRVHPLLRDLLVHRFRRDDSDGYRRANRTAARWFNDAGESVAALGYAVAAGDWQLAGEVFLQAAPWIVSGHRFTLERHLQAIPYTQLPPSAALDLCAAGADLIAGRYDTLAFHVQSARRRVRDGDVLPALGLALIELFEAVAARQAGDPRRVLDAATAALTHLANTPPSAAVKRIRPIAVHQRTVGLVMLTGDVTSALEVFSAVADAQPGETTLVSFNARVYQTWCLALAGRLDESERVGRALLRDAAALGWTSSLHALPAHLALAMIHLQRAEEPEAYRAETAGLAATAGVTELWPIVALHLTRASTAAAGRRPRAALSSFENALSARGSRPVPRALADLWLRSHVDVALLVGEGPPVGPPMDQPGPAGQSATWWSSSARCSLAHSDLDAAEAAANQVVGHLRVEESVDEPADDLADMLAAIEAHLVLAVVADRRRRPHASKLHIRAALERARAQRIVQPFLAIDPGVAVVLQRALTDGVVHADDFVDVVLARLNLPVRVPPEPDPLIEPLTERQLAVLNELPTWKTYEEISAEFYVSVNTVKSHVQQLFRKLDVPNRHQAVLRARELGLLP